jgi:hypothetical protein
LGAGRGVFDGFDGRDAEDDFESCHGDFRGHGVVYVRRGKLRGG